jgi:diadenosine tetraphosphate (Ap4A) HIT family hydrolase
MPDDRIIEASEPPLVVFDAYPLNRGHSLVVSRRHVADVLDLTVAEVRIDGPRVRVLAS